MKLKITYLFVLLLIFSCNKYDGPYRETTRSYYLNIYGNGQKTLAGEYFSDSIKLYVNGYESGINAQGLKAVFSVDSGGGTLDKTHVDVVNNSATTKWKSGNQGGFQRVKVDVYKSNDEYLCSTYFNAYAFRKGVWDMVDAAPDAYMSFVLADTIHKKTWMGQGYSLYIQKDNYFSWEQVNFSNLYPSSLMIDKKGTIYMKTNQGQILKSTDGGNFWNMCASPMSGQSNYYNTILCNNGYLYTSSSQNEKSLRCSRDGGLTWSADTAGLKSGETFGDIFQLGNGDILYHTSGTSLYKSTDDGKSWKIMPGPENSTNLYVTKKDEIIVFSQYNGVTIYKSTDLGQNFKNVYSVMPSYNTTLRKEILQKGNYYYILIPYYGIVRTTDFEQFETFWQNSDIQYLFQTHQGALIAKGINKVYYFRD